MFQLLKKKLTKQQQPTVRQIHYDAFGNAIPHIATKKRTLTVDKKTKKPVDKPTELVTVNNNVVTHHAMTNNNGTNEQQLAKALSQQMHYALDKMNQQLNQREMRMEERFATLTLERQTTQIAQTTPKSKKRLWLLMLGGLFATIVMTYLLYIMQNMQTSMQTMSTDIGSMTTDITQMSTNTQSMSNNMETMNQGISGMNQQMEGISTSIEPMGETAQAVSPFAKMFNQFSPF